MMKEPKTEQQEGRVLILAPTGRDAELACRVLSNAGISPQACGGMEEFCREVEAGAGAALLTEEALVEAAERLFQTLDRQPPWSDLPFILFSSGEPNADVLLETIGPRANVTILERPIRITTVVSAVRAALRARYRQYQMRDLLQRLEAADRQKDLFLAMLGHELRNPLHSISGAVQLLDRISSKDEQPVRLREIIKRQVHQLSRLIDDLLDVSRINSGKIILQPQPVDLNEIAERCLQSQDLAKVEHHSLSLSLEEEPVIVLGDPVRLEQVISNLLSNAVKYTPPGGRIHLSVRREGEEGVVRVEDSGVGIAPEMLSAVFELFTQLEGTLDRSQGGLGLGLTLVRRLVEKHGGTVTVLSAGVGQGSEFIVRLPICKGMKPSQPAGKEPPAQRRYKILVVEDNAESRNLLRFLLETEGHSVEVAEDGQTGAEMALAIRPEVALIDLGLPILDGYQLARQVRTAPEGDRIFMIALSGYGQPEDRKRSTEAGFSAHLVKPLDMDDLVRLLNNLPTNE
jgi:signal transduction histidine kinase/ActR/RegA family two-component response regulator